MIRPILACEDPYDAAETFISAGWRLDFSQPPESGDPLVGVSLFENSILLGITDGYAENDGKKHLCCGVEIYLTIPPEYVKEVHKNHGSLDPTNIEPQPWGAYAFCGNINRLYSATHAKQGIAAENKERQKQP